MTAPDDCSDRAPPSLAVRYPDKTLNQTPKGTPMSWEDTTDNTETDAFAEAAAASEEAAVALNGDIARMEAMEAKDAEDAERREAERREAAHAALDDALATLAAGKERIGEALELLRAEARAYRDAYDIAAAVGMTGGIRRPETIQGIRAVDSLSNSRKSSGKKRARPARDA